MSDMTKIAKVSRLRFLPQGGETCRMVLTPVNYFGFDLTAGIVCTLTGTTPVSLPDLIAAAGTPWPITVDWEDFRVTTDLSFKYCRDGNGEENPPASENTLLTMADHPAISTGYLSELP